MTTIQRIKDQPGGVWAEDRENLIVSAYASPSRGATMYVQPYVEEVMKRILRDLEERGYDLKAYPDLFKIVSSYRTQAEQDVLFAKALAKYKTEALARKYVAKISAHQTGAVIDIDLGGATVSENIPAFEASPQYADWADLAYNKYKMAPYDTEPWHWECGDACKEAIANMIQEEAQSSVDLGWDKTSKKHVGKQEGDEIPLDSDKPPAKDQKGVSSIQKKSGSSNKVLWFLGITTVAAAGIFVWKKRKSLPKKKKK